MAAGRSTRINSQIPKQFCKICDRHVIQYSLSAFEKSALIDSCLVMIPQGYAERISHMVEGFRKVRWILTGGETRHQTSVIALDFLRSVSPSIVVFHDAARPFLSVSLLEKVIEEAKVFGAATAAVPITDTVAYFKDDFVNSYIPRDGLYRIQTPQAFRYDIVVNALKDFEGEDSTKPVFLSGEKIRLVEGDSYCFKITKPKDLELARVLCRFWKGD